MNNVPGSIPLRFKVNGKLPTDSNLSKFIILKNVLFINETIRIL